MDHVLNFSYGANAFQGESRQFTFYFWAQIVQLNKSSTLLANLSAGTVTFLHRGCKNKAFIFYSNKYLIALLSTCFNKVSRALERLEKLVLKKVHQI